MLAADLAGATINKVEVKLKNIHTWSGSGMTARIGRTTTVTSGAAPASPVTSGDSAQSVSWARGATSWVTMPAGWWTSAMRSITLGSGAGTGTGAYGKFSPTLADCQLRITYTK